MTDERSPTRQRSVAAPLLMWLLLLASCAPPPNVPEEASPQPGPQASIRRARRFNTAIDRGGDSIAANTYGVIAVLEFATIREASFGATAGDAWRSLGDDIRERVTGRFLKHPGLRAVEHSQIVQVLKERAQQQADQALTDDEAARIGKILRASTVALGVMKVREGGIVTIYMRTVDVATAQILAQAAIGPMEIP